MSNASLIRVGDSIINLDNVIRIDLDCEKEGESCVVFEFLMRGLDESEYGENIAKPFVHIFGGHEAEAIRMHLKKLVPDLLAE